MLIKGESPTIYNLERQGTTVMCDGSSILQGEDIETTVGIFLAWDETTMLLYLELLEEEYGDHLYAESMAGQFVRQ